MSKTKACNNPDHEDPGFDGCFGFVVILFGNLAVGIITMHHMANDVAKAAPSNGQTTAGAQALVPVMVSLVVSSIAVAILNWHHENDDDEDDVHDDDYL